MAFAVKYRAEFETIKGNRAKIDILEDAFGGAVTNITVGGAKLRRQDGEFNKFEGIRQSELDFEVLVSDGTDPEIYLTTSDVQYRVNLYINGVLNWVGWLDSSNYRYQLRDGKYLIALNAKDGLHLLENSKFEAAADSELFGQYKLTQYIYTCLKATGLIVSSTDYTAYNTWINIYPDGYAVRGAGGDTTGENDPLNNTYIDSTVFRTGVNEYDNCFVVLNKICSAFKATLFQRGGEWHFIYVEDWVRNIGLTSTKWDYQNDAISYTEDVFQQIEVGLGKAHQLAEDNANVSFTSLYSKARLELSYQNSDVKIKNQDFSKVDEASIVTDGTLGYQYYDMMDWDVDVLSNGGTVSIMQGLFNDSNPLANGERWMQFRDNNAGSGSVTATSAPILASLGDMFNLKFEAGFTNSSARGVITSRYYIRLTDGVTTNYLWSDGKWRTTPQAGNNIFSLSEPTPYSLGSPKTFETANVDPIPFDGDLYVLFDITHASGTINYTMFVKKLELDYKSYLGYRGRTDQVGRRRPIPGGQFYESSEDVKVKNDYREDIYLFNSPQISIPGAILDVDNDLIQLWVHKGLSDEAPFGRIITDGLWKGLYRRFIKIESNLLGVVNDNQIVSHYDNIVFDFYQNKIFLITTIDVDIRSEQAEFTCVELLDETNTDDFDQLATTRKTGYISDLNGKLYNFYDRHYLWEPPDNSYGELGRFVENLFKKKRRRSR